MAISDKTRKLLWGKSANRCAICKNELAIDSTSSDDESIIGEECHINSIRKNGPRYDSNINTSEADSYDNLILLCRIHHKMIDDQAATYTAIILKDMKSNHEQWVTEKLAKKEFEIKPPKIKRIKENIPEYLKRLENGQELISIASRACEAYLNHDELNGEEEVELVGSFLSMIEDWIDCDEDFDLSFRVRIAYEIGKSMRELEDSGFYVCGAREIQIIESGDGDQSSPYPVVHISVIRQTNEDLLTGERLFKEVVKNAKNKPK